MLTDVIIPAVSNILAGIAGVGANVHPYIRIAADDAAFNTLFLDKDAGRIHGYTITREKTDVVEQDIGAARDMHTIILRGYMGAKDADGTETLMQNEVETVRTTFFTGNNRKLGVDGNGKGIVFWTDRISVRQFAYSMFSGVLCHYAELVLMVHDYPIS